MPGSFRAACRPPRRQHNPVVTYPAGGIYGVTLTVTTAGGSTHGHPPGAGAGNRRQRRPGGPGGRVLRKPRFSPQLPGPEPAQLGYYVDLHFGGARWHAASEHARRPGGQRRHGLRGAAQHVSARRHANLPYLAQHQPEWLLRRPARRCSPSTMPMPCGRWP